MQLKITMDSSVPDENKDLSLHGGKNMLNSESIPVRRKKVNKGDGVVTSNTRAVRLNRPKK